MWRFVSAARMAQIKADARAEGYIKAVREGLVASNTAKEAKQSQQIREPHVHTADRAVQEIKQHVNQAVIGRKRRSHFKSTRASYGDPNMRLITDGAIVEEYIFKNIGNLAHADMANNIIRKMGTHVRGCTSPIKVMAQFIGHVLHRRLVWDANTNAFVNVYYRSRNE